MWARVNREFVEEWKLKNPKEEGLVFFVRAGFRDSSKWAMLFWEGDQMVNFYESHDKHACTQRKLCIKFPCFLFRKCKKNGPKLVSRILGPNGIFYWVVVWVPFALVIMFQIVQEWFILVIYRFSVGSFLGFLSFRTDQILSAKFFWNT